MSDYHVSVVVTPTELAETLLDQQDEGSSGHPPSSEGVTEDGAITAKGAPRVEDKPKLDLRGKAKAQRGSSGRASRQACDKSTISIHHAI